MAVCSYLPHANKLPKTTVSFLQREGALTERDAEPSMWGPWCEASPMGRGPHVIDQHHGWVSRCTPHHSLGHHEGTRWITSRRYKQAILTSVTPLPNICRSSSCLQSVEFGTRDRDFPDTAVSYVPSTEP